MKAEYINFTIKQLKQLNYICGASDNTYFVILYVRIDIFNFKIHFFYQHMLCIPRVFIAAFSDILLCQTELESWVLVIYIQLIETPFQGVLKKLVNLQLIQFFNIVKSYSPIIFWRFETSLLSDKNIRTCRLLTPYTRCYLSIPPKNSRKPKGFLIFTGVQINNTRL